MFDYEAETRDHYKSDRVAQEYHAAFTEGKGLDSLRFRWVAARERSVVKRFLARVPHSTVLDIPVGTGKLAPLFKSLQAEVVACDVSPNMITIAQKEYAKFARNVATFQVCDAERVSEEMKRHFDVAVCLRLLHRVPSQQKKNILRELASVSDFVIASFGIDTPYHRVRGRIRVRVLGGGIHTPCYETVESARALLAGIFDVMDSAWVLPWLSQEMVFLLRTRRGSQY